MKRTPLLLLLAALISSPSYSQNRPVDFSIEKPKQKVANSLYTTIDFLDSRDNTYNFGFVPKEGFLRPVIPGVPFNQQLSGMVKEMTTGSTSSGEMLLQFREFAFGKYPGEFNEKGYCYIKASLYAKAISGGYQMLDTIDSIMVIKSRDITRALFKNGSLLIADWIASNLVSKPVDTATATYEQLVNINGIEKDKIPLYVARSYTNGVYKTFRSFRQQTPDIPEVTTEMEMGEITKVSGRHRGGDWEKIRGSQTYAIVCEGVPYISTNAGFYRLEKRGTDFYFIGKFTNPSGTGLIVTSSRSCWPGWWYCGSSFN